MVNEKMGNRECKEGVNETWNEMRDAMRTAAKEVCGVRKGRPPRHRETWWWPMVYICFT